MKFLYNIAIHLIVIITLFRKRSRHHFLQKLGMHFPLIEKKGKQLIWIHAVSVGETKAAAPLVRHLKAHNDCLILFSNGTATGHEEAKKSLPECDFHVIMPFDLSYRIRPLMKKVKPDCVIIVETDFWFHFQDAARELGSAVILVNGKISKRSHHRFLKFPSLAVPLFATFSKVCVQGNLYLKRFSDLKIPKEKIVMTGNIKLDGLAINPSEDLREKLALTREDLVFTCGSTHDPEEKIVLQTLKETWKHYPALKVMIVPRHPERFNEIASLLKKEKIAFGKWSLQDTFQNNNLILVDAMGVLRQCYQISTIAFVGGSLTEKVGGHNILEPAYSGIPVLYGPYMYSQPDFLDLMRAYQAGVEITSDTIGTILENLLASHKEREEMGKRGLQLVRESSGAIAATMQALSPFFPLAIK